MGDTIWVLTEDAMEDDWDHSLVLRQEKKLDRLSTSLGLRKLSDFFDYAVYAEEYGGDVEPNYVEPAEALETIEGIIAAIRSGHASYKPDRSEELLEELEDMRVKISQAAQRGSRVRLSLIQ